MRDHDDDHDARALVLRHVRLLVGAGLGQMDFPKLDLQPGLSGVSMHAAVRAGRPVPRDNGSVRGSRDADDDDHDHGRAMLAVLHDDNQQHDNDNGGAVRDGILRVGMGAVAGCVVDYCLDVSLAMPMRDT